MIRFIKDILIGLVVAVIFMGIVIALVPKSSLTGSLAGFNFSTPIATVVGDKTIEPFVLQQTPGYLIEKVDGKFVVTLTDTIKGPDDYRDLIKGLNKLKATDTVVFVVQNFGGRMDTGINLIDAFETTKATIVYRVIGPSYSMASVLACSADKIEMKPLSFLMFHMYLGDFSGSGAKARSILDATDKIYKEMLKPCVAKKIIKQSDVENIMSGKDLYVFPMEVGHRE